MDVYEYAERVTAKGFVYMDTPGYDPVSATGQVWRREHDRLHDRTRVCVRLPFAVAQAVDQHGVVDEAGRGHRLELWQIADGTTSVDKVGERLFELMLATCSGEKTKSEKHGYGQSEFVPWYVGAVM